MKQSVLDVLVYLFENYMVDETEPPQDHESLETELRQAGFHGPQISKAFDWLEGLTALHDSAEDTPRKHTHSIRIYTDDESERLGVDGRSLLLFLENMSVIDSYLRELILDRVMALETDDVDLDTVKWVVLMVLFNQPGHEAAYAWVEDFVINDITTALH
jgi:Smg protein